MASSRKPSNRPRPVRFLADAVETRLRPMMAGIYKGVSVRGSEDTAHEYAAVLHELRARNPAHDTPELTELIRFFERKTSSWGRSYQRAREQLLKEFNEREFSPDDEFVGFSMDGTPMGGEQVVWVIGTTKHGVKIPVIVESGPSESAELVAGIVEKMHARGIDTTNALWTIDGGLGLRAGILRATNGRATIQLCRVHKQRNILKPLSKTDREATYKELRTKLDEAWGQTDPKEAGKLLEGVAVWLESKGFKESAAAARHDIELTLTVQRLGLTDPEVVKKFTNTNAQESANRSVADLKKKIVWVRRRLQGKVTVSEPETAATQTVAEELAELDQLERHEQEEMAATAAAEESLEAAATDDGPDPKQGTAADAKKGESKRRPPTPEEMKAMREGTVAVAIAGVERSWKPVVQNSKTLDPMPLAVLRDRRFPSVEAVTAAADGSLTVHELPSDENHAYVAMRDLLRHADRTGSSVALEDGAFADAATAEAMRPWLEHVGFADGVRPVTIRGSVGWTQAAPAQFTARVTRVPARRQDIDRADRATREALGLRTTGAEEPAVVVAGSSAALDAFGVQDGQSLTVAQATTLMRGRDLGDARYARAPTPQALLDADQQLTGETAHAVAHLAWELNAPDEALERWLLGDQEARATLERTLLEGARAGLDRLYGEGDRAVALTIDRGTADHPQLKVRGVVLGVGQGKQLTSPVKEGVLPHGNALIEARADATDLATVMLDAQLARMGPGAGLALPRALDQIWTTADHLAALGEVRGGWIARQATSRYADLLADWPLRTLVKERDKLHKAGNPFDKLDRAGAAETLMRERQLAELKAAGRDGPEIGWLERRIRRLTRDGHHPSRWAHDHLDHALKFVALERECAARAGAIAKDGGIVHRLEPFRQQLGGKRLRLLTDLAHMHAEELADRSTGWLQQRATELRGLVRPLAGYREQPDAWMERYGERGAERVAVQTLLAQRERALAADAPSAEQATSAERSAQKETHARERELERDDALDREAEREPAGMGM